jgi:acetyltransferase-like isoleucine patch superfamily enzyme
MNKVLQGALACALLPFYVVKRLVGGAISMEYARATAFRALGCRIGTGARFQSNVELYGISNIEIGTSTFLGRGSAIIAYGATVKIGCRCLIARNVLIISRSHLISGLSPISHTGYVDDEVHVGDDVWVGAGAMILSGVRVGSGAVIGAGAVVTKSVDDYCIVGGVPAKVIGTRS